MSDVPDWIVERMSLCADVLGCNGFRIRAKMSDAPEGDDELLGACRTNHDYLRATVTFNRSLENDLEGREVVAHEMIHVALMHLTSHTGLIIQMLPEDRREFAQELLRTGVETSVERMARALTPYLDRWEAQKPTEAKLNGRAAFDALYS